jgi:ribonuclease VapC
MIVVDASALIAILLDEPQADALRDRILRHPDAILPAPAYLEAGMVYGARKGAAGLVELDNLIADFGLTIMAFTADHAKIAQAAFMTYGKGRHRAGLNFGDCMSYAVAKAGGWPLLYVGGDFGLTDVAV